MLEMSLSSARQSTQIDEATISQMTAKGKITGLLGLIWSFVKKTLVKCRVAWPFEKCLGL
jgi:hypothetical protein